MTIPNKEEQAPVAVPKAVFSSRVPDDVTFKPQKPTTAHPHPYLRGNFYPVFEETIGDEGIECEVIGIIPESLRGSQYIRTGPNSAHIPDGTAAYHFFDGDGMLHGVYFQPGIVGEDENTPIRARYMNRYVRGEIFRKTNKHGPLAFSIGLLMNNDQSVFKFMKEAAWKSFKMMLHKASDIANGNTALAFIGNRLLALNESGTPIEATVPSLDTIGHYFFEEEGKKHKKRLLPNLESCTAHPKVDPKTGETVFFAWRILKPFVVYSVISANGERKVWEEPVSGFTKPTMVHDFAITPTYSIIMKMALVLDPVTNIRRKKPIMSFDETVPAQFGIIPRYFNHKKDKVLWFNARSCHIFHTANAWDERDADGNVVAVCMTACRSERFHSEINLWSPTEPDSYRGGKTLEESEREYVTPGDGNYDHQDPDAAYLTLFRFDLKTMETQMTTLTTTPSEFPVLNYGWYTRPELRYTYLAIEDSRSPGTGLKFDGIIKIDTKAVIERRQELLNHGPLKNVGGDGLWEIGTNALQQAEQEFSKVYKFGGSYFGGEAVFVPNSPRSDGTELDEDDGHLLVYVYDESQIQEGLVTNPDSQVTELWIFNAKRIEQGPVVKVKIPRRVPYGFHGIHITRKQIQANKDHLKAR